MKPRISTLKNEADVAIAVVAELQRAGWETYEEVSTAGRRADIVGTRGPLVYVVECKQRFSLKLLDQLTKWHGYANYIVGAYDSGRVGAAGETFAHALGIGLWGVGYGEIHQRIAPKLQRRVHSLLLKSLRPEQRTGEYAQAGTNSGGYFTPFRATCRDLHTYVLHNPGVPLRDALKAISHHYSSNGSALSSLPGLIRTGKVPGLRIEDGRPLRLYAETPTLASRSI